jgi:hypothetical protein
VERSLALRTGPSVLQETELVACSSSTSNRATTRDEVDVLAVELQLAGLSPGRAEQILDQLGEPLALPIGQADKPPPHALPRRARWRHVPLPPGMAGATASLRSSITASAPFSPRQPRCS